MIYGYSLGTTPIAASGHMKAFGRRLLVKAILDRDDYKGALTLVTYNALEAVAFEIVSVGAGVAKACAEMGEDTPVVGQHCDIRSVAADRVNGKDASGRYWLVQVEDVAAIWDPVDADDAELAKAIANATTSRVDSLVLPTMNRNGAVELEASE